MKKSTFKCAHCPNAFSEFNNLQFHLKIKHGIAVTFECHKCRQKFKDRNSLSKHLREHKVETPHKCTICGMYYSEINFKRHLCKGNSVQCEYCTESFETTLTLLEHLETHELNKILRKCEKCPKLVETKYFFDCHMEQHQIGATYQCEICKQLFDHCSTLCAHKIVHTNETGKLSGN